MVAPERYRLRQAHRAFTRGRIKLASRGLVAAGTLILLALVSGGDGPSMWFGAGLMVVASVSLYVGRGPGRAVLPAFVVGLVPFSAFVAMHAVAGDECPAGKWAWIYLVTSLLSGFAAGALLVWVAVRLGANSAFILVAAAMTWFIGTMGYPCVETWSVLCLAAAIATPTLWVLPRLS